jgi:hypothetical protein
VRLRTRLTLWWLDMSTLDRVIAICVALFVLAFLFEIV